MKELNKKIIEEYRKSKILRELSLEETSFEHQQKIRKEQEKAYKKLLFLRGLEKAIQKGK